VTSPIINPALNGFARATGKVTGQGVRRTLTVVFEAIVEAHATKARRQVSHRATSRMGAAYTVQVQTVLMGPKRNHFFCRKNLRPPNIFR
jgi:hypothetical protein